MRCRGREGALAATVSYCDTMLLKVEGWQSGLGAARTGEVSALTRIGTSSEISNEGMITAGVCDRCERDLTCVVKV